MKIFFNMKDLINEAEALKIKCEAELDAAIYFSICVDESLDELTKSKKTFLKIIHKNFVGKK